MNKEESTYSNVVIEIADYLYSHPGVVLSSVTSNFAKKYNKSERTVWRYLKEARAYNVERIRKCEKAKDGVLRENTIQGIEKGIVSREETLKVVSSIIRGHARKAPQTNELIIPSDSERLKAVRDIWKMLGWSNDDFNINL
jgi:hypothetical protein